jgi:hypothetical protein
MVAKIPLPIENSLAVIARLADERTRYRGFYDRFRGDWLRSAELYIEHRGDPVNVRPLNLLDFTEGEIEAAQRKQSLINLYVASENQFHYEILASLRRDHQLIICPSCGAHVVPGTLDHYLPKTEFPEFSVLLVNLTPMCNACQESKGASFLTANSQKKYLHSYFDEVFLPIYSLVFSGSWATPEFSIHFNGLLPAECSELVREHLSGTKVEERFLSYCGTKYVHLLKIAEKLRREGNEERLEFAIEMFLHDAELNSINCWEAIFYRSVLETANLLSYLKSDPLPERL